MNLFYSTDEENVDNIDVREIVCGDFQVLLT